MCGFAPRGSGRCTLPGRCRAHRPHRQPGMEWYLCWKSKNIGDEMGFIDIINLLGECLLIAALLSHAGPKATRVFNINNSNNFYWNDSNIYLAPGGTPAPSRAESTAQSAKCKAFVSCRSAPNHGLFDHSPFFADYIQICCRWALSVLHCWHCAPLTVSHI